MGFDNASDSIKRTDASPQRCSNSRTRIDPHLSEGAYPSILTSGRSSSDSECRHSAPPVLSGVLVCFFFPKPLMAFFTPSLSFLSEELNCLVLFVSAPLS